MGDRDLFTIGGTYRATGREIAHALLDDRPIRTINGHRFSGSWWITTTGALAYQDVTGATHHLRLADRAPVRMGEP